MNLLLYIKVIAGFGLLFASGSYLVKGGVELSRHFRISPLVVGLTVVAFGTSAPELFVSVAAGFSDVPDISIGNIVGSNIANIALILGSVAVVFPISVKRPSVLYDWAVMMLSFLLLYFFGMNGKLQRFEGIILFGLIIAYIIWSLIYSRRQSIKNEEVFQKPEMRLWVSVLIVVLSIVGLYFGAEWLVAGSSELAIGWGISERVVGISVVAFGTSIPELATSLAAALKKEMDISVGNIIGSNIFNVFSILGITATLTPLRVSERVISFDIWWMMGIGILLMLFMIPLRKGLITRFKGIILLLIYIVYIWALFKL
ncbi:calcium/sodium antiporter [Thermophagus xiamenensis]|uniref:Cation:H+ antiporter n=1 Tax=Thermophagus xiamenensis TaxID=385682 RepID=A0A1I2AM97_9BACT|nr:calcium/sodium antiporter [Thermophagus xiamenensis]SFE44837.1 cation:H+ antiporter [Thermophagus xiamenensis]